LGGLWALEWAWHSTETKAQLRSQRLTGQTDMARSTRLVILIKNIYTLWGRKRLFLPVTYFPTNLVYPFTLRVKGKKIQKIIFSIVKDTTQLVILIKNIYTLWGRKSFLLPTNLVYPFTLRVTGITMDNSF